MAQLIRNAVLLFLSKECTERYLDEFDFFNVDCFKAALSKALGFGIIGGSLLVKVPQIFKILQNESSEGINIYSVLLDLFSITSMSAYSFVNAFPFSAWGDGLFVGIQTLIIAALVLHYRGETFKAATFLATYAAIVVVSTNGTIPMNVLWLCQAISVPINLSGKLIQAFTNYSNGGTGQISAITVSLLFLGTLGRIFTSVHETGDTSLIVTYASATIANGIILSQVLYYWRATSKASKDSEKIKKIK